MNVGQFLDILDRFRDTAREVLRYGLPLAPILIWGLLVGAVPGRPTGTVTERRPVPILSRLGIHAPMAILGLVIGIVMVAWGIVGAEVLILVPIGFIVMVAIPLSYTLTTDGIRLGHGRFRRWTEFAGVRRGRHGCWLLPVARGTRYPIFLSRDRDDDEFIHRLRTAIKSGYKWGTIPQDS